MEIETEIPQFFTPKTQTRKVKMLKQERGRREINSPPQFSEISVKFPRESSKAQNKSKGSKENSKFKSKTKKGPNYIKLAPIYTLSILGFWDLDGLLIW